MSMNTVKRIAAIATSAALFTAVPTAAFAQTESAETKTSQTDRATGFDQLRRRALVAINTRLDAIARWTDQVETVEHLPADDRSVLLAELTAATRGLSSLESDIQAVSTFSELGGLAPKIVEDFRVFALLGPKVHLVIGAGVMDHVGERFDDVAKSIQDAIDRIEAAGYEPADAQTALDRMRTHLVDASALIGPVPGRVLALQPADMPEANAQLRNAQAGLESAGEELRAAQQAAHRAVEAIKNAIDR